MTELLIVIGGSTASGKSALAATLAARLDGVIVNADSQQLFRDLPILTARPTRAETDVIPHRLYGVLGPEEQPSVGRWQELAEEALTAVRGESRPAIVVGGSGLYLHALLRGIPEMPRIPEQLRSELRAWAATCGAGQIHARLSVIDPEMATRLQPGDSQRLLRALEVRLASGRSLLQWQAMEPRRLPVPGRVVGMALVPMPEVVVPRIHARLETMLAEGALREVGNLLARRTDALRLPIAKVHGMRELAAVHRGSLPAERALAEIAAQIRQYAKRQRTWFRHQLPELQPLATTGEAENTLALAETLLGTR
ncbi:MAG: tRNA (adenosine(37)-N6)-dimethylallyltransferase MiaA [Geminicoccaceae bacterium]